MNPAKQRRLYLEQENRKYTEFLEELPRSSWPHPLPERLKYVYRSNQFLVQVFEETTGFRLTVCRTRLKRSGDGWDEQISWDDLWEIKNDIGYRDFQAIEIYPRERDLVNVASMRHLWVLTQPLKIGWFARDPQTQTPNPTQPAGGNVKA